MSEPGGLTPVRYGITEPEISDVIFQGNLNLKLGYKSKKNWLSIGYANKPGNDLHKLFKFSEELATSDYFVQVEATTKRQELFMADIGTRVNNATFWASYLKDKPETNYERDNTWQETVLDEQDWFSAGIRLDHFYLANLSLSGSYIKRVDKEVSKETLLGFCLLYTSPSPRDRTRSRMPSSA